MLVVNTINIQACVSFTSYRYAIKTDHFHNFEVKILATNVEINSNYYKKRQSEDNVSIFLKQKKALHWNSPVMGHYFPLLTSAAF